MLCYRFQGSRHRGGSIDIKQPRAFASAQRELHVHVPKLPTTTSDDHYERKVYSAQELNFIPLDTSSGESLL